MGGTRNKVDSDDVAGLVTIIHKLDEERTTAQAALYRARSAVHQYIVAMGPHLSDEWKDVLAEECGLEIDESSPYRHPKKPTKTTETDVTHEARFHEAALRRRLIGATSTPRSIKNSDTSMSTTTTEERSSMSAVQGEDPLAAILREYTRLERAITDSLGEAAIKAIEMGAVEPPCDDLYAALEAWRNARDTGSTSVLEVSAEDEALVDRIVTANMPKGTTKRLLARKK